MTAPDPRLDAIKERYDAAKYYGALAFMIPTADVAYLLSVVEAQAAQITKVRELAEDVDDTFMTAADGAHIPTHLILATLAPEGPEA